MTRLLFILILALAILVGAIRPFMPQRHGFSILGTYEAFAHIVVGMLIGGWILATPKRPFWIVLLVITAIEIVCALRK